MGVMIEFASNGGTTPGWLAQPRAGAGPGVIVIQEWWGLNNHVKAVAERFASEGFTALAPDLYHGQVTKSPDEAGKLLMAMNIAQAEQDLRETVRHLGALTGKPVSTVGFCMDRTLSLFAACVNGKDVGACVIYYGGHPKVTYDFDALAAPVLGHWAEDDAWANTNIPIIETEMKRRLKFCEFHTYPGTKHAFFNDERPEVYVRDAAELSFERTLAFLRAHL